MAPSTYDVNVQLALATTAEHEGDLDTALDFLSHAHQLARETDRATHARVHWASARFRARYISVLPIGMLASML
jgi:Cdc6-like AAA superfamily ATPase